MTPMVASAFVTGQATFAPVEVDAVPDPGFAADPLDDSLDDVLLPLSDFAPPESDPDADEPSELAADDPDDSPPDLAPPLDDPDGTLPLRLSVR
ncbi:MAG: hypothetical protein ACYCVZ_15775 [Streptosporangiaceae bacterium]